MLARALPTRAAMSDLSARAAALAPCLLENAVSIDVEGAFPTQEFRWLHEAGLLNAQIVRAPALELLQTLWHVGRGNLAVGRLYEGHVNALQLIDWFGSPQQKARYFAGADDGQIFAVWNTQAANGIRFETDENDWLMRGAKTFCSGAGHVTRPIVTGEAPAGWQMCVVPTESATLKIDESWWQPMGMRASASFAVDFEGTTLSNDDLLGSAGDYYGQPAFSGGAMRFCAVQLGGAAAIAEGTRRFLCEVNRAEDEFQRARIGRMTMKVQSGWQWLQSAARTWDELGANPLACDAATSARMVAFAAMMRLATEEICLETMQLCEQSVGARGLMRTEPFERQSRDLTIYLKQPHLDEIAGRVGRFALESQARADELWS